MILNSFKAIFLQKAYLQYTSILLPYTFAVSVHILSYPIRLRQHTYYRSAQFSIKIAEKNVFAIPQYNPHNVIPQTNLHNLIPQGSIPITICKM